jgi:cation diffusion facilitator family transporter
MKSLFDRVSRLIERPGFVATLTGLIVNTVLCVFKLGVGFSTSSLALLSDGVNSLTDAVSSLAILIAVRYSHEAPDEGHPFGHRRAEPIAGLILAIFAGIAGFEILQAAAVRLYTGETVQYLGPWPFVVLAGSVLAKGVLSVFFQRIGERMNSPAILAGAADSRIDILISLGALLGITGAHFGFLFMDTLVALVISFFIFRTGYRIGSENIDYLMGKSPGNELLNEVRSVVTKHADVKRIDELRAHYVGHYIHVEAEISASRPMSRRGVHDLEEDVRSNIEEILWVDRAFVHVNPD